MTAALGIGLAFVAMLSWGFGDFMMQKSAKRLGDWETLFFITFFGSVILAPFVWRGLPGFFAGPSASIAILVCAALVLTVAAVLTFEGFKRGKISVLEPLMSVEILSAAALSFFILGDHISPFAVALIILLIVGLFLVSYRGKIHAKSFLLEKGIFIFIAGSILMGASDFLMGWGSRVTDPLLTNFIMNVVMTVVSGAFILLNPASRASMKDILANRGLLLAMSIADNIGWVAYAFAMTLVPIAVATGLSESSVIIAVLLGIFVNKERLQRHQKIGLAIALASVLILASIIA